MTADLYVTDHTEHDRVRAIIAEHHPELHAAGVTITVLRSRKELKLRGTRAYAAIRITPPRERALGSPDAVITIDGLSWDDHSDETRTAIYDHELTHLTVKRQPKRDDAGKVVMGPDGEPETEAARDQYDRPKLKMRPHDREFGWFDEVAQRHGAAAIEVQQAQQLATGDTGQVYWLAALRPEQVLAATGTDGRATPAPAARGKRKLTLADIQLAPKGSPRKGRVHA
jgi:hypothetical protein